MIFKPEKNKRKLESVTPGKGDHDYTVGRPHGRLFDEWPTHTHTHRRT
jgi:hypothetical protein